jgi:hypothetical protein
MVAMRHLPALLLSKEEIDDVTTADVWPRRAQVAEDLKVIAARVFQGVGQNSNVVAVQSAPR